MMCECMFFSSDLFFKQKTAYELRISDWSSDVCSSDLVHGFGLVLVLRSLVLASDDDSSRNVGDAHRRIGRIDMLPARTGSAIGVDLQVAFVDFNINIVVNHGINPDARKAG